MLVMDKQSGNPNAEAEQQAADASLDKSDPNRQFTNSVIKGSQAEKASATRLTNLNVTIAQGKIMDVVLETAINSDLPGTLRGIVSRDVYAEAGRVVMIPKGSRLIGTYNTGVSRGQRRLLIVWTRLLRPDGIDMQIGSPGVDTMGRGGIKAMVDNKYTEIFSAAILTSILNIGVAVGANALIPEESTTTTTNANGTTTSGSVASTSASTAVNSLGGIGKDVVNSFLDLRPTLTVDQGTRIIVFVNRDLIFPRELLFGARNP
jgi:type IV secretion system protein VirB10